MQQRQPPARAEERVMGGERGRVSEKTEVGVGEDVHEDHVAAAAEVDSQLLANLGQSAVHFNAVCKSR